MTTAPPTGGTAGAFAAPSRNGHGTHRPATTGLPGWTDRLPTPRRQRRPALAVAGALLVLLCGVASAALAARGDHRLAVLALARDIPAGQVLTTADLRVAHVAGDGVSALSAAGQSAVVGQTLTATLPAGTLLNASMLSTTPVPAAGLELVAVAVRPGGMPAEATAGRDVSLIRVETTGAPTGGSGPVVLVAKARLISVRSTTGSDLIVLSVQVPASVATEVAQASAAGEVAVTLLPVTP